MLLKSSITVLSVLLVAVQSAVLRRSTEQEQQIEAFIVGGSEVSILRHPYIVSLRPRSSVGGVYAHSCGGSLLDSRTVLTAAHCVKNRAENDFIVVAGTEFRAAADGTVTRVAKIVSHELYNASITDNDIALVFLDPPIDLNNVTIASIALAINEPTDGALATVVGWGTTEESGFWSPRLLQTQVPIVHNERCQESYNWRPITDGMLCAGLLKGGRDTCQGDSGGPLLVDGQLTGIVSWGEGCGREGFPGVYARIAYYTDWIAEVRAANVV